MGGEMRRQKSLRIGVHHADAVVWGPVYRTRLMDAIAAKKGAPAYSAHPPRTPTTPHAPFLRARLSVGTSAATEGGSASEEEDDAAAAWSVAAVAVGDALGGEATPRDATNSLYRMFLDCDETAGVRRRARGEGRGRTRRAREVAAPVPGRMRVELSPHTTPRDARNDDGRASFRR
jgi:hypothetical protein